MKILFPIIVLVAFHSAVTSAEELLVEESKIEDSSVSPITLQLGQTEFTGVWSSLYSPDEKFTPIVFSNAERGFGPQVGVGYGPKTSGERRPVRFFCKRYSDGPELFLERRTIYFLHTRGLKKGEVERIGEFEVNDTENEIRSKAITALKKYLEQGAVGQGEARPLAE